MEERKGFTSLPFSTPPFNLSTIHTLGSQVCTHRLHRCEPPRQTLVYQNATKKRTRHFCRVFATTEGEECRVRISAGRQATPKELLRTVHTEADGVEIRRATYWHTLSLAPNSITLLRAQRLSHQGVASQHEKPNEGAGFFFLSLSRSICSSIVGSYVNVSTTQHPEMRAKRSAVPIARIIISPFP